VAGLPAKEFLKKVLQPSTDLAAELAAKVKELNTRDPTYRYQIAAIVLFLSGVDKALSVACQLLYIGGRIEWKWLKPRHPEPGVLGCGPGLMAKITKFKGLGLDLSHLKWLVELRNEYIHEASISVRYQAGQWDDCGPMIVIRACGPEIGLVGPPLLALQSSDFERWTDELAEALGAFVDQGDWQAAWRGLASKVEKLSIDRSGAGATDNIDELMNVIDSLTEKHIGIGLRYVLPRDCR